MNILEHIAAYKRDEVIARRQEDTHPSRLSSAPGPDHPPRGFLARLRSVAATGRPALIAEIKKASPSRGVIRSDFDPEELARGYAAAGAACLSVLTDQPSFQGRDEDLVAARAACTLPVLRKDFLVDPWQVRESRDLGADAVLVILAMVDDGLASKLVSAARELQMDVLIEVHDAAELHRAVALETGLIGINSRDLRSFHTDLSVFDRLAPLAPLGTLLVAESGIVGPRDVRRVTHSGAQAILVGESLMRQADVTQAVERLFASTD